MEPREALVAGVDGLAVLRRLVAGAARVLVPGGWLLVEIGAGQAAMVRGHSRRPDATRRRWSSAITPASREW